MIHRFSQSDHNQDPGQDRLLNRSDIQKQNPLIQVHDPESRDHGLAASLSEEIINISGASVIVYLRTDNEDYDKDLEEDPDPTYHSGVHMKAYFVPQPRNIVLTKFGVDAPNKTELIFNRAVVFREFSDRMIRAGDVIELPYNATSVMKPDRFRVLDSFDFGNYRYTWLYWKCVVENITGDITIDVDNKS